MTAFLELRNVSKVYFRGLFQRGGTVALEDFSFSISGERSSITVLAGESGSGKTTTALLLLGFITPTGGEILYQGKDLRKLSPEEWRAFRREVQVVFQDPFAVYNPFYKVDHVLSVPIAKFHLARSRAEGRALIEEALLGVGLRPEETLGRYPHQLSGGQRQRVTVARALLLKPRLLIADEPVSMVDASLRATILESLRQLNRDFGISILYITHDLTTAYHIGDDIIVLYQGSVTEVGEVDLVIKEPLHPYTRLLVDSIPWPDPERRWGQERVAVSKGEVSDRAKRGCKFAERCPSAMSECRESAPPLFQTSDHRATACYLYREAPAIQGSEIGKVLAREETKR